MNRELLFGLALQAIDDEEALAVPSQLGLALVRYWWGPLSARYLVVAWLRETARWPKCIETTGEHGGRWVAFEDVLDAGWLGQSA